ncbi:hypothetical protein KIN20_023151 [Parelaphostrongylus tenuis]|uniref:Uncharacterized protein n=1 Tax=Parelaphostrongylus tenuis TaxID=148309 RepID=A0AAD5QVQ0_PARTN|nr:hypothetical protein KIN20_023151 [Parelaphostrongylus tenuis]
MWSSKLFLRTSRTRRLHGLRHLLSQSFSLEQEWASRHVEMAKLGLGGDYEWISAVQKKFIGGGVASAIDVDAAVYIAEQKDQVDDVVDLVYKLRHSGNAADLLPSTEYALIRLLLRYNPSFLFELANDPINYGVFMNEHAACLAIDHFIKRDDFGGAARLSAWIMQQEMTENELLNLLVLYSCAKWAELPTEQQTMPSEESEVEEVNEEDVKTFKFPYLKNPHFDSHFDLTDPHLLVGKTLLWVARDSKSLPDQIRESFMLLGAVLYNRLDLASTLISPTTHGGVANLISQRLAPPEGQEPSEEHKELLKKLECCQAAQDTVTSAVASILENIREKEEEVLASEQKAEFTKWDQRRQDLIKAQADRLLLKIRAGEIENELAELDHYEEKLSFFENRLKWEEKAKRNQEFMEQNEEEAQKSQA